MSDLQIGLLIVGALVIVGVIAYNRIQEMRFRRRAERAFAPDRGDALLEAANVAGARIEPLLQPEAGSSEYVASGRREPSAVPVTPAPVTQSGTDSISYAAELSAPEPLPAGQLSTLMQELGPLSRRVRLEGQAESGSSWTAFQPDTAGAYHRVRVSIQLADRGGALTAQDLAAFQSAVARCAASLSASAEIPEGAAFARRARELDAFCAEVDVVVGINIQAPPGKPFSGTRLRGLAEAAGFRLTEQGTFAFGEGHGATRFNLENQGDAPFTAEALRTLTTPGVTLLLDVPRLTDGIAVFDQMVGVGRNLANSLGGTLVDDNQVPVTSQGLEQIRHQLRTIYARMEAQGIPAGGAQAQRLFA